MLIDAGFEYDSSIFPIRHDRYGIPGASRDPGPIAAPSGRQILEFPLSVAEWAGLRVPVAGGGYFRLFPYGVTRTGIMQINGRRQPAVFYMHPWEIDPQQPRVAAGWLSRFRHYNNLEKFEPRLLRLLQDFRFTTMHSVLRESGLLDHPDRAAGRACPAA